MKTALDNLFAEDTFKLAEINKEDVLNACMSTQMASFGGNCENGPGNK